MFLPCSLLIQDGFSEDNWKEAGKAIAAAKVRVVEIYFDYRSNTRHRAVETISTRLARNKFIREIRLYQVPEETIDPARQRLRTNSGVKYLYMSFSCTQ